MNDYKSINASLSSLKEGEL
jgi:hypothetical protein